ncbi:MAG TPA: PepSY-like domain-containing protein [Isosphaeraceae bacterium]|nr:PepSY-like domain-containing protein [Isosphaeraceae bacterium]
MRTQCGMGVLALFGVSVLVGAARAGEEEVPVDKLPAAVKKAIKAKFPKAEIEEATREVEDGTTTYEVKLEVNDRSIDIALKANGTILEVEKEIPFSKLPKAVKKALAARYPQAKIQKVEEVTKGKDGPLLYEIAIQAEVVLTAKGKAVHERAKPAAKAKQSKDEDEDQDEDEDEDEDHHHGDAKARKGEHHGDAKAKTSDKDHEHEDEDEGEEHGHVKAKKGEKDEHHAKASAKSKKDKDEDEDDDEDE